MKSFWLVIFFFPFFSFAQEVIPVAVVGSGPAGLSAALVTGRERVETHVFLGFVPGGPVNAVTCLGNWPGSVKGKGHVVMNRLFEQVKRFDVHLHDETILEVDFSKRPFQLWTNQGELVLAESVIIATGAFPRLLSIEGEEKYLNHGIDTYLYPSEASKFLGKTVAIVGSGIDAMKKALIAAKFAEKVYLLVRSNAMQKPFMEKRIEKKGNDKIEILYKTTVQKVLGEENQLKSIEILSLKKRKKLQVDALILAAGILPNSSLFAHQLQIDSKGYILLEGRTQKTSVLGVFAAGNVTDSRYRQAGISAGDGMKAGYDALEFLQIEQGSCVSNFVKGH